MPISVAGNKPRSEDGFTPARRSAEHGFTPARRSAEHGFTPVRCSAEHGFTPVRRSAEHGFTLVELMIVVTIIGLASAAVVLSLPDPRGRLADEASRFALRARAAHDLAIVQARPVSIWVTAAGYGFDVRRDGAWAVLADKPLQVTKWGAGTQAVSGIAGRDRVVFDSTGIADRPFDVRLLRDGQASDVHVGVDGTVKVDG